MAPIDFARAADFIAAVPDGRWTAYKDVAEAGGNARGAQAVGGEPATLTPARVSATTARMKTCVVNQPGRS